MVLAIVILAFNALDVLTFLGGVQVVGIDAEANGIMKMAYGHGIEWLLLLKLLCSIALVLLVLRIDHRHLRLGAGTFALSIAALGIFANLGAMQ